MHQFYWVDSQTLLYVRSEGGVDGGVDGGVHGGVHRGVHGGVHGGVDKGVDRGVHRGLENPWSGGCAWKWVPHKTQKGY